MKKMVLAVAICAIVMSAAATAAHASQFDALAGVCRNNQGSTTWCYEYEYMRQVSQDTDLSVFYINEGHPKLGGHRDGMGAQIWFHDPHDKAVGTAFPLKLGFGPYFAYNTLPETGNKSLNIGYIVSYDIRVSSDFRLRPQYIAASGMRTVSLMVETSFKILDDAKSIKTAGKNSVEMLAGRQVEIGYYRQVFEHAEVGVFNLSNYSGKTDGTGVELLAIDKVGRFKFGAGGGSYYNAEKKQTMGMLGESVSYAVSKEWDVVVRFRQTRNLDLSNYLAGVAYHF